MYGNGDFHLIMQSDYSAAALPQGVEKYPCQFGDTQKPTYDHIDWLAE